jgi:hypothetical protein
MTHVPPSGAEDEPSYSGSAAQGPAYPPPGPPPGPIPGAVSGPYGPPGAPVGAEGTPYGGPGPHQFPGWRPPVHQPGVVPLRPLTLGDIFGGALKTIRHNPKATVGMATLVTFGFMLIPIVSTILLGAADVLPSMDPLETDGGSTTADVGPMVVSAVNVLFSLGAGIVVTGLIVRTVEQAVIGRPITAGEAWRLSKGRLLRLLGLLLLVALATTLVVGLPIGVGVLLALTVNTPLGVVVAVLGGILGFVVAIFLYTRYVLLAAPVLVLEERGVFASLARAGQLSRRDFWRLLGIYLLANLATSLIGQVIAIPFAIFGIVGLFWLPDSWGFAGMMLTSNLSTVLTGGLLGPFTGGVLALQYIDQRFRKEGLDIELLNQTSRPAPR